MKRYLPLLLFPVLSCMGLFTTSCHSVAARWEKLSGPEERNYPLGGFHRVELSVPVDVKIRQSKSFSVRGTSKYKGVLDLIDLSVRDSTLYLTWKKETGPWQGSNFPDVDFYVSVPYLRGVALRGSGDIDLKDAFTGTDFTAYLHGSGDIEMDNMTLTGDIEMELEGSGDISFKYVRAAAAKIALRGSGEVSGKKLECTDELQATLQGSGTVEIHDNRARSLHYTLQGSGDFKLSDITAKEDALMEVVGSGDLIVKNCNGDRKVALRLSGSGDIRIANLMAESLETELVMSGDIRVTQGNVGQLSVSQTGSGDIYLKGVQTQQARVWRKGSGDIDIHVTEDLFIDENEGSGAIRYIGSPNVRVKR